MALHLLNLPDECLLMVYSHMDLKTQCLFALTCCRLRNLYYHVNKTDFRYFVWKENFTEWKQTEIEAFFKLNGHKMQMLSIADLESRLKGIPPFSKAIYMVNVCVYLQNLRSLNLIVDLDLTEILIEVCKHINKLENLTVDSVYHPNYEILALLPRLKCLDIQNFVKTEDRMFQRFSELHPDRLEHLRIGSALTIEMGEYIPQLRSLRLLNIFNPNSHSIDRIVLRVGTLRVLSITNSEQLHGNDLRNLIIHLKLLSSLYINDCQNLKDDFVLFVLEYLEGEVETLRRLPFRLQLSRTGVSKNIKKVYIYKY